VPSQIRPPATQAAAVANATNLVADFLPLLPAAVPFCFPLLLIPSCLLSMLQK